MTKLRILSAVLLSVGALTATSACATYAYGGQRPYDNGRYYNNDVQRIAYDNGFREGVRAGEHEHQVGRRGGQESVGGNHARVVGTVTARTRQFPDRTRRLPWTVRIQRAGRVEGFLTAVRGLSSESGGGTPEKTMNIPYITEERPDSGLTNGKLGIWLFLASEVMLFGALFSTYIILRTGAVEWPHGELNVWLGMRGDDAAGSATSEARSVRVDHVSFVNVPSFVLLPGITVKLPSRMIRADVAFGGAFYAIVDCEAVGLPIDLAHLPELRRIGMPCSAMVCGVQPSLR